MYRSVIALTNNEVETDFKSSLIEKTRSFLDSNLASMATKSYERSYQYIVEAQILTELEEILEYKNTPSKSDSLIDIWWTRLQGCERSLQHWHRLLLVKSIVLPKEKYIKPWLKFSSMCQKAGQLNLSQQILNSILSKEEELKSEDNNLLETKLEFDMCKYAHMKFLYANNQKREALVKLEDFVSNNLKEKLKVAFVRKTHNSENVD